MATGASSTGARGRARVDERGVVRVTRRHLLLLETMMGARCTADASDDGGDASTRGVDEVERRLTVCRDARAWCR